VFWENRASTDYPPLFTYSREYEFEYEGLRIVPLKILYLEARDITEYLFVQHYFLTWTQWKRICKDIRIGPLVEEWREELALLLRAEGMQNQIDLAKKGDRGAGQFLAKKGWEASRIGRPPKSQAEAREKEDKALTGSFKEDAERIGIH